MKEDRNSRWERALVQGSPMVAEAKAASQTRIVNCSAGMSTETGISVLSINEAFHWLGRPRSSRVLVPVVPLGKEVQDCEAFGVSSDESLDYAQQIRAEWETYEENLYDGV
jgi:hypothetical protein